ncbi:rab3 GTPase-activating protein [Nesidiocoris tenuis]|uniref:Rab3 GTPase-activating protein n=1 Tax=Nesidiocoris tenuis TaxID=355587 RepID=A0ABN7A4Z4_9HEMI|nr:rab3 GTPase-activating protein [Nesidiocoris tenuis]
MSCQFKSFANIVDVAKLKSYLFAGESLSSEVAEGDDAWNWTVDEPVVENWIDECFISLSPSSEVLVFGRERNLVILEGKWDSESAEGKIKYHISWNGDVTQSYNERITCLLSVPLAGQGKLSTHGGADWTCVAVGFNTGAIRFYTENGRLLLGEVLHEEPVRSISCQCYQPQPNPLVAQVDELHVAHSTVVCCVQGFALCNSLKTCRNQLARIEANCSSKIESTPLTFIKWGLPEQEDIKDVTVLGTASSTVFNHLTTASLRGGYYATYRSGPPQVSTVIATGSFPFVAWHCLLEGSSGPILTDVAKAVASKFVSAIGSAVPGWLGVNKKGSMEKTKEKAHTEPAELMSCRFGLCDSIRKGQNIYMSPQRNLSAVCDSLGRVILIDNVSGLALRMWKGYRDAECAFIPVEEDKGSGSSRRALYLAIYAPKKAIIEVWALQQGPKIVSFHATKNGRLMYIKHGLLGANSISHKHLNSSLHPCVYIFNTGELKQVCVPFHPILSNKNDPRNRDIYLFKQVKRLLRTSYENSSVEIPELCKQVSSDEFKLQILEFASSSKHNTPELMEAILTVFETPAEAEENDTDCEVALKCRTACQNYRKLVTFYGKTMRCVEAPPEYSTVVPSSPTDDEEVLSKMLKLSVEEVRRLLVLVSLSTDNAKVSFKSAENKFSVYLSNFSDILLPETRLKFCPKITSGDMAIIGEVLCQCVLYGGCSLVNWTELAVESGIEPKCLLHAAIAYWLKKPLGTNIRSEMSLYVQLLFLITSLLESMKDSLSWWDNVRTFIIESGNSLNALTSTIISRAVYLRTEKHITDEGLLEEGDDGWETISRETCLWSQLLMQVEAVAVLQSALNSKPKLKHVESMVPALEYVKPDISLANLLLKGPGLVAESVAKWVASWGMEPEWFLNRQEKETTLKTDENESVEIDASAEAIPTTSREDLIFQRLELIRKYFPYSLTIDHLIANVCWEYVSSWAKQLDKTEFLVIGLRCLKLIPDLALKLGLCSVIWNVHLKVHFENIVKLFQKIGKLPKDRLCQQHVNVTSPHIKPILQCIVDFYEIFLEAGSSFLVSEDSSALDIRREAIWTEDCSPSLVEISLAQAEPHIYILKTQSLCARALLFIAALPLRLHRPVTSLLYPVEESLLWMDIRHADTILSPTPDAKIEETRLSFLLKIINATTDLLCSGEIPIEEVSHWIGQCYSLAYDWEINADTLRVQQVINLYKNNGDRFAEEVLNSVNDKSRLGAELLILVGQRMKKIISESSNLLGDRIAHLSPNLSNWIQEQEESKELSDLKDTIQLAALVVTLLPESSADYKFANLLLEGIQPLSA